MHNLLKRTIVIGTLVLFIGAVALPSICGNLGKLNNLPSEKETVLNTFSSDLVGWWSFDEGSGNTAKDHSGNGNDGIIYGGAWTNGIAKYALSLDGYNDYVIVPDSPSLDITQEITLSAWVIFDTIVTDEPPFIVYKRGDGDNADEKYKLGVDDYGTGKVQFKINKDAVEGGNLLLSRWYHIVGTFDGNVKKIFLDGVEVIDEAQVATIQTSNRPLFIGVDQDLEGRNQFLDGVIDEVRIYSRALTDDEVEYLYNNPGNQPPNKPDTPSGPPSGNPGVDYTYSTITTDPEGLQVYYMWDWGDDTFSSWLGPYDSGVVASASHNWSSKDTYEVRVKAKDGYIFEGETDWSDPLEVTIPRNKATYNSLFHWFLDRFPILNRLFNLIK
jgi:hypothetical protein